MKCKKCGYDHRSVMSCEEARMTREHRCWLCSPERGEGQLEELERIDEHSRNYEMHDDIFGREGYQASRCPECRAVWLCRYQWDSGTGRDNVWFIISQMLRPISEGAR